ncbi:MAG: STAS domain-containing protein [Eubacterium sp.]|nr:STAS domain-containing protein [Eubacterium sp.]MBR7061236.1 STAS domain-containing protein [Eubacterium sp.]
MELSNINENGKLTISVSGRVDTVTAPELEKYIEDNAKGISQLILDLKDMSYTSSAGLRVILKAHKLMSGKGEMKIINVQRDVMDIFEITGFCDILNIN